MCQKGGGCVAVGAARGSGGGGVAKPTAPAVNLKVLGPFSLVTSVPIASTPNPHLCASSLVFSCASNLVFSCASSLVFSCAFSLVFSCAFSLVLLVLPLVC